MRRVCAGFSYDIDDAARCTTILRGEAVCDDLELLHCVLRHGRPRTAGDVISRVGTVYVDRVRPRTHTAKVQSRGWDGPHGRRRIARNLRISQGKVDVVSAICWQVIDA